MAIKFEERGVVFNFISRIPKAQRVILASFLRIIIQSPIKQKIWKIAWRQVWWASKIEEIPARNAEQLWKVNWKAIPHNWVK